MNTSDKRVPLMLTPLHVRNGRSDALLSQQTWISLPCPLPHDLSMKPTSYHCQS